jgi:hypothetical protein
LGEKKEKIKSMWGVEKKQKKCKNNKKKHVRKATILSPHVLEYC